MSQTVHLTDESRYDNVDWIVAEEKASEDYRMGNIKMANSIDEMFEEIIGKPENIDEDIP